MLRYTDITGAEVDKIQTAIDRLKAFEPADKGMMSKTKEAFDLAIAALREKQEREKGCGWCLTGKASADAEAEYCPMCGRKLERR